MDIEAIGETLDAIDGVTPVHAFYYNVSSKYYKVLYSVMFISVQCLKWQITVMFGTFLTS